MLTLFRRRFHFCQPLGNTKSFYDQMSEALKADKNKGKNKPEDGYKSRYNGRVKKRQWEDYGSEGNPEKRANFNPEDRVKRRKWCLLLGYSGANYYGMQRNPDVKTIEEELLVAMLKRKWITEEGFKLPQQIQFQRAARTDKGVSAARQCVSMKLPENLNAEDINQELPSEIQIFGLKRVTKGFNSKDKCDARTYTYTLPTISFADHGQDVTMEDYRLTTEKLDQVNALLTMFVGTKNYHNFTSRKHYADPSSNRHIISFCCAQPFVDSATKIEFAVLKVKGQSFMLHQIRKMIGLTLAIVRGLADTDLLRKRAFTAEKVDVPMAPGLGLVLDEVHYDRYNTKYGTDGMHDKLEWMAEEEKIQKFFHEHIFPTIVNTEMTDKPMVNWLETLPLHSYEDRTESHVADDECLTGGATDDVGDESLIGVGDSIGHNDPSTNKNLSSAVEVA
ncbi:tRNA pseudouridine synthase A [Bradysia coprophila]|uniref:tRNA pseudouridine synthase A n=1 Tax=Bradysia coprophila TaxID=38358 RepID=UPI00187D8A03|nr:tRNA pseudouridine synthase A [Bradysia coprophila]